MKYKLGGRGLAPVGPLADIFAGSLQSRVLYHQCMCGPTVVTAVRLVAWCVGLGMASDTVWRRPYVS